MKHTFKFKMIQKVYKIFNLIAHQYKMPLFLILVVSVSILSSCKTVSTADQKAKAEQALDLARSVEASEYAPDAFNSAISSYDEANINSSEKNEAEANVNYNLAIERATEAYNQAVAPYTEDLIAETDRLIDETQKALEDNLLFDETVQLNDEAWNALANEDYLLAKEKTLAARENVDFAYQNASEEVDVTYQRALQEGERYYIVKYNPDDRDCLWKIADRELGNPLTWKNIYNRNNDIIDDPDLIYPDQELILPNINSLY